MKWWHTLRENWQALVARIRAIDPNNFWQVFRYTQMLLWSFVLVVIFFFMGVNFGLLGEMPDLEEIQNPRNAVTTTVYTSDFEVLGSYFTENRIEIGYDELSPFLVKGLLATEDKRFYEHSGIDLKGLFRAVIFTGILRQDEGGGSTITQQLAKNLFHRPDYSSTWSRVKQKIKEWVLAAQLEKNFTKEEIVNLYFNTILFGYNSYGIKTAAHTYFYKTPKELKPEEAATLVAMLNGPSLYNPRLRPELTKERRNLVLRRMAETGLFPKKVCDSLQQTPLKLNFHNPDFREGLGTYFREQLRQDLKNWCAKNTKPDGSHWDIYKDGLKVYTTIDSRMQLYAEEAMREHLTWLQDAFFTEWKGKMPWMSGSRAKKDLLESEMRKTPRYQELKEMGWSEKKILEEFQKKTEMTIFSFRGEIDTVMSPLDSLKYYLQIVQVGFMAMDAKTGEVKAWIGGPDIRHFQLDHAKKTTRRQVGSTIKPLQYAVAIERGYEPCTLIPYEAPEFEGMGQVWNPEGTDRWSEGTQVPMQDGLAYSDNRITAQLMSAFGPEALVQMARQLQIESPLDAVPALCLGVSDVSLYEMMGAYSAFANLGTYSKPFYITRIEDKDGNVLAQYGPQQKEALPEKIAYTTTEMMKGVVNKGTASRIRGRYGVQVPMAGKTGTTQSNSDAWFIGFTPSIVAGCWVGFEQPSVHFLYTNTGQGATAALPIVGKFLFRCINNRNIKIGSADFSLPSDSSFAVNFSCDTVSAATPDTTVVTPTSSNP